MVAFQSCAYGAVLHFQLRRVLVWPGISRAFLAENIMAYLRRVRVGITIIYRILVLL
jgi:hypothetical protein